MFMLLLMNLVCTLKLRPKNQCGGERLNIYCVSWFPKEMNVLQVRVDQRKSVIHRISNSASTAYF